jgi:ATP-binding cassette, subfamily G (WHITE), member 2, SNQ2
MIVNEGRCVYFGDARKARQHFVSLGYEDLQRQTSADYLTGKYSDFSHLVIEV